MTVAAGTLLTMRAIGQPIVPRATYHGRVQAQGLVHVEDIASERTPSGGEPPP